MNFASYEFWQILLVCFLISRIAISATHQFSPEHAQNIGKICLMATGLVLLGLESTLTLIVFLWVVSLSWVGVILASRNFFRPHSKIGNITFWVLLLTLFAPLFYYKYWDFFMNECLGFHLKKPSVLIPMGLSFYTFQKIGFWIDTIKNPGKRPKLLDYLNFCAFFPQIVAGPIERKEHLLPQLEQIDFKIHKDSLESAIRWIILGLAYKLIVADNMGNLASKFNGNLDNAWHIWYESFAFGIRIYFDFAGYSFIAVGLALVFGVKLTMNFHAPYWSPNMREFWRRWHITLGAWLRNYVYLPMGGRKVWWWGFNTLAVFIISGIWHGAGWGFLLWGLMHGVGVYIAGLKSNLKIPVPIQIFITFCYANLAWMFFIEQNPTKIWHKLGSLVSPDAYSLQGIRLFPQSFASPIDALTTAIILGFAFIILLFEGLSLRKHPSPYQITRHPAFCLLWVILIVLLSPMEESPFIYFNF